MGKRNNITKNELFNLKLKINTFRKRDSFTDRELDIISALIDYREEIQW